MSRIILQVLFFSLVLATNDPDDLSSYKRSIFLPYACKFSSRKTPTIRGTIKGKKHTFPVDTGSTGLIIGAPKLPSIDKSAGDPGCEFVASRDTLYTGHYVTINITFYGENDTKARSLVPVLVADNSVICPSYDGTKDDCICPKKNPKENDISKILSLGVGFGLNTEHSGLPFAIPSHNPFLNIKSINGKKVSDKTFRNGYTVSTKGVYLGLTPSNTEKYNWVKLDRGPTDDLRDWAQVRTSFKVDGKGPYSGCALIDTGVGNMFIQASSNGSIPLVTVDDEVHKSEPKGTKITLVKDGTHLDIGFPTTGDEGGIAGYDFIVGDEKFKAQPTWVEPITWGREPYINTGRKILWGFSVAFDAVGGRYGFKCLKCDDHAGHR